ncbi:uncharacterized protein [Hyperolius riggenbachi]
MVYVPRNEDGAFQRNKDFLPPTINCTGASSDCIVEGSVCASIYALRLTYSGSSDFFLHKTCLPSKEGCGTSESLTIPGLKVAYSVTCCSENECTPQVPVLPPVDNKTKNGVFCPACFGAEGDCEAQNSMACTGEEKYCLKFQKMIKTGFKKSVGSGCASENVCKENRSLSFLAFPGSVETFECFKVNSNIDLKPGFFIWCGICHDYNVENCGSLDYLCSPSEDVCLFERVRNIYVPNISDEDNGLTCPACFVPNSDRCLGRKNLKCTGEEKRCIHYMRTEKQDFTTVTESLYGCTTDAICEAGSSLTLPKRNYYKSVKTDIACNRAATLRSLAHLFFTSSFVVLFVLKANL